MSTFLKRFTIPTLFLIITIYLIFFTGRSQPVISPIPENHGSSSSSILGIFTAKKDPEALKKKIQQAVDNTWNNYSVYVVDYNSPFAMSINETEVFNAASVNKIPILAGLYVKVQKGEVDFDTQITLQAADIQDYGTGSIRYDPPGSTYSVKTLARLMMQKSDNTAAFLLANYVVGIDTIQSIVDSWGMGQTDILNNKTSNKDMANIMRKIYDRNVANPALTQEMLGFLKDSDFEDRIPGALPSGVTVYHKIGTGEGQLHDVGIVTNGKVTYYIGIFTSDITDEATTTSLMANVSKLVFEYMN